MLDGDIDFNDATVIVDPSFCNRDLNRGLISRMKGVKNIILYTTSVDWMDTLYAKENGIKVFSIKTYSAISVSEYALLLALSLIRKYKATLLDSKSGTGRDLFGKNVGVIGYGNVGSRIGKLCQAFGAKVSQYSTADDKDVPYLKLNDLIEQSDVVFCALPNSAETKDLMNRNLFLLAKPSQIVVSTTDGLLDDDFMIDLVKGQKLGGLAIDWEYSGGEDISELNVIYSHHSAYNTTDADERSDLEIRDLVLQCVK